MYTFDGILIKDLMKIPKDEKILLVSDHIPNLEEYEDGLEQAFVTGVDPKYMIVKEEQSDTTSCNSQWAIKNKIPVTGMINNIYQFENKNQIKNYKTARIEKTIINTQADWIKNKYKAWEEETPGIYEYHRQQDLQLQAKNPVGSFVTLKMRRNQLPSLKALVAPMMADA